MRVAPQALSVVAVAAMALAAACEDGTSPAAPRPDFEVSITDAPADALPSGASATPDIVSASWSIWGDTVRATVTFAPGAHLDSTYVSVNVDNDGDPATGDAWGNQGVEFIVSFGAGSSSPGVEVFTFTGSGYTHSAVPRPLTTRVNGFAAEVPLSMLGGDDGDGQMTVRFLVQHWRGGSWTGVLDMAPDQGQTPAVVAPT